MDFQADVTYTAPDGTTYQTSATNGSGWNGAGGVDTTNVATVLAIVWSGAGPKPAIGDHWINPPNGGVWKVELCMSSEDHYYFSGPFGDTIFLDRDGSGTPGPGEGLENVTIELFNANGTILLERTWTDENGNYFFGDLDPNATYTVKVKSSTLPPGLTNSVDPDGGTANQSVVNLKTVGPINLLQDFGYVAAATPNTIGGTIWEDSNADGTLEGSEANRFAGVTVVLYDANRDVVATTVTDANGDYSFTGLPDGAYTVDVTDDANLLNGYWHSDGPNDGQDNNSQTDPYTVSVAGGQTNMTGDFGYYVRPGKVGNFVWADANGDGLVTNGEVGLANVEVTLTIVYPGGGSIVLTTLSSNGTTDVDGDGAIDPVGSYSFNNLLADEDYNGLGTPGVDEPTFTITAATPQGYVTTHKGVPDPTGVGNGIDNNADLTTNEPGFPFQGGVDNTNDFGFHFTSSLAVSLSYAYGERAADGTVYFLWETATETGNAGFNLYMALADGNPSLITAELIPSRVVDSVVPVRYSYEAAVAGDSYYIEMVDISGSRERYGPYDLGVEYGESSVLTPNEASNLLYLPIVTGR